MASGRPIFGPSTPDLLEILEDGRNAVLVQPDDLNTAREKLGSMLDDESLLKRLGERARHDIKTNTWDNRAKRVLDFISDRLCNI